MPHVAKSTDDFPAGSEHVLTEMLTHKVDLVDLAANMRRFVTIKSKDDQMPAPKKTPAADNKPPASAKAMALPAEARTSLIEGVQDALEKLAGAAQALKESTVDDAAQVPDELPRMIKEAADVLAKVAGEHIDGASETGDAGGEPDPAAKARRITPARMKVLQGVRSGELGISALDSVIGDGATEGGEGDGGTGGDSDPKVDETGKVLTTLVDSVKLLNANMTKALESAKASTAKAAELDAEIKKMRAEMDDDLGESRSAGAPEREPTTKGQQQGEEMWPDDLSAAYVAKQATR